MLAKWHFSGKALKWTNNSSNKHQKTITYNNFIMQQTQHNKNSFNEHEDFPTSNNGHSTNRKKRHQQATTTLTTTEEGKRWPKYGTSTAHRKTKKQMQRGRGRNGVRKWREEANVSYGRNLCFYIIRVKGFYAFSPHLLGAPAKLLGAQSNSPQETILKTRVLLGAPSCIVGVPNIFLLMPKMFMTCFF